MAAQVLIYSQPTDTMCWTTPPADMTPDDRQQSYSNGAYAWASQSNYLQTSDNSTASYSDSSGFSGGYDPGYSSDSHQYPATSYSHDPSELVGGTPADLAWVDVPLDPNAIYHVSVPLFLWDAQTYAHTVWTDAAPWFGLAGDHRIGVALRTRSRSDTSGMGAEDT